jgi:hypothetical protein
LTKIVVQGLDEDPTAEKVVLDKEAPEVAYILCSDHLLEHIAKEAGYDEPNQAVLEKVAEKTNTKIVFKNGFFCVRTLDEIKHLCENPKIEWSPPWYVVLWQRS